MTDSKTSHTPGPWVFHTQPVGDRIPGGHDHSIQCDDGVVVLISPPGLASPVFKNNACLIAAAPELLEALTALVTADYKPSFLHGGAQFRNATNNAIKAIAKAEGRDVA